MILLSLLLAAAPPVLLEPDAGNAHRLHPRRVTASSFLENGWNKHEQNYLPLYIADEDPTTAWVEGVKGRGEGESIEWWGPSLTKAKSYRLFVRNGFQKTDKLFRANARPRNVKLEPLVQGETGPQTTGTPLEVELKDVRGWQEVVLPVPAKVEGVRLTLVTTYPGSAYEDTCLSDLRVYVEGDDPYRAEAEAAAFEEVRSFAYERKQAAARNDTGAKLAWAPRYTAETLLSQERRKPDDNYSESASKRLASVPDKKAYHDALVLAREVADLFQKADLEQKGPASEARSTWARVKPAQLKPQKATARAALSAMEDDGLVGVAGLLHLGDVSFFEADTTQAQMLATIARTRKQESAALKACVKQCVQHRKDEPLPAGKTHDCDCEGECTGCYDAPVSTQADVLKHQLEGGEFLQGPLANPTAFLRGKAEESGSRESWLTFRQTLVRYAGDKADVVLVRAHGPDMLQEDEPLRVHVLEWTESGGKARLASITTFLVNNASLRVVRYRPASRT
ncbi:NADase-type glycan-binding domain-containing protein [Corallococcus terminator]|uniref:NAD glycohydrolase translocation F5/8 type C domain-containing protein n=1 Tax=Corallococcus terminator TaxID=2316733 RepID=A0A3A8IUS8_9BACT|nr:hypothetical protein [Corallococcus terminator]RKG83520.1 hypothetical protein D7V88_23950 [Corallococcus terminator]